MFLTDHFGCNVENVFVTINEAFISQRLMDSPYNIAIASQKENESKGYQKQTPISLNSETSTIWFDTISQRMFNSNYYPCHYQ